MKITLNNIFTQQIYLSCVSYKIIMLMELNKYTYDNVNFLEQVL